MNGAEIRTEDCVGSLPIFPPDWVFLHAVMPPRSGDKDILSTYLQFTAKPA
ncbi:2OG-Fe(II) oxygenase [Xanthomonas sp. GPE 39]|uniref:2OG-Fe(II) oxygenase n=1 Tax=Xanthomonas sp. GPE 39 TaxID=1583099 RepID=UPI000AF98C9F|nr:2OG-Fe(II) oxygenase [Xanthomonas sp. GPE 39]